MMAVFGIRSRAVACFRALHSSASTQLINFLPASSISRVSSVHFHQSSRLRSRQTDDKAEEFSDEPVKYSTSSARTHSAYETFLIKRSAPWYQSYMVLGSTIAFLVYFLVLREENDLDEEIGKSLFERIPGLEEKDLQAKISNAKSMGLDSKLYEKRLKEIQAAK